MQQIDEIQAPHDRRRAAAVALLVAGAFFMENLDGTVIATALPQMARSFGVSPIDLNMGMTVYMLTLAVFIPVSGWMADRYGARVIFSSAIALFTGASVVCGFSQGLWEFTTARVLQGIGGAMMVPVGRLVVLRITEKKDLLRAIAYLTWPGLAAPVLGPPLGGFITTYWSWRWIFFLNIPLGVAALALSLHWVRSEIHHAPRPLDWTGFALAGSACTSLLYGMELVGRQDASWAAPILLVSYGILAGSFAVRRFRVIEHPLLDLSALRIHTYAVSLLSGSLFRIAVNVSPFLLPLMFQVPFGLSAFHSGLLLLALFAGNFTMKSVTTPVLRRFGFRRVLIVNGILTGVLILSFAALTQQAPLPVIAALLFVHGLSRSMQFTSVNTLSYVDVPKPQMSGANTFASVLQQLAMGMGVAVGALALRAAGWLRGNHSGVPALADFHIAFALVAIMAFAAVRDCFTLDPHAGAEVTGHRPASVAAS
ncbi:MAG TPA: MFS transporter [Bryobacteraceae bacterium]|nr:MFS transporter [Bryobacteraceae bacterium]